MYPLKTPLWAQRKTWSEEEKILWTYVKEFFLWRLKKWGRKAKKQNLSFQSFSVDTVINSKHRIRKLMLNFWGWWSCPVQISIFAVAVDDRSWLDFPNFHSIVIFRKLLCDRTFHQLHEITNPTAVLSQKNVSHFTCVLDCFRNFWTSFRGNLESDALE